MALEKDMELSNGVAVRYHRIVRVEVITNVQCTVEVASYPSGQARAKDDGEHDVYLHTSLHVLPYDEALSVPAAYEALKTLPEYAGAVDA